MTYLERRGTYDDVHRKLCPPGTAVFAQVDLRSQTAGSRQRDRLSAVRLAPQRRQSGKLPSAPAPGAALRRTCRVALAAGRCRKLPGLLSVLECRRHSGNHMDRGRTGDLSGLRRTKTQQAHAPADACFGRTVCGSRRTDVSIAASRIPGSSDVSSPHRISVWLCPGIRHCAGAAGSGGGLACLWTCGAGSGSGNSHSGYQSWLHCRRRAGSRRSLPRSRSGRIGAGSVPDLHRPHDRGSVLGFSGQADARAA